MKRDKPVIFAPLPKAPVNVHIRKMPGDLHSVIRMKALQTGVTMEDLIIRTLENAFK